VLRHRSLAKSSGLQVSSATTRCRQDLNKLDELFAANPPAEGDLPLLTELLSLPFDGRYPSLELTPQRKKERTFEALLRQLAGLAQPVAQPVLMIFEDLHWVDPTSRELLDITVERVARMSVLLIATFRPEFLQSPLTGQPHVTTLSLRRLGRKESGELVRGIIGSAAPLPHEVMDEIVERTDGVPLFLEELTKAVVENAVIGSVPAASLAVPATQIAGALGAVVVTGNLFWNAAATTANKPPCLSISATVAVPGRPPVAPTLTVSGNTLRGAHNLADNRRDGFNAPLNDWVFANATS
jgi:predicted ATPase